MLYLVLRVISSADSGLGALLLTAGSPVDSPHLVATRFDLARTGDGALFDWRAIARTPNDAISLSGTDLGRSANYFLPSSSTGARLGARDLRVGDSYSLIVETAVGSFTGRTRIPNRFTFRESALTLEWQPVEGAAGFQVVDRSLATVQRATTYRKRQGGIPSDIPARVIALDTNLYEYLSGLRLSSAGITAGLGVFGAATEGQPVSRP